MSMIIQEIACFYQHGIESTKTDTKERQFAVGYEELAQMWNTWVQTGKGVLALATQIDLRVAARMIT
eukprot:9144829-Ditylum_brightwellii.AAC.1